MRLLGWRSKLLLLLLVQALLLTLMQICQQEQ
jgi:hypothetical protein